MATVKLRSISHTIPYAEESPIPVSYPYPLPTGTYAVIRFSQQRRQQHRHIIPHSNHPPTNIPRIVTKYHSPRLIGWQASWLTEPVGYREQKASVDSATTAMQTYAYTWGEQNNPVAKKSLHTENLQHYYFLATGLFCSPQVHSASKQITHTPTLSSYGNHSFIHSFLHSPEFCISFIFFLIALLPGHTQTHTCTPEPDNPGAAEKEAVRSFFFSLSSKL